MQVKRHFKISFLLYENSCAFIVQRVNFITVHVVSKVQQKTKQITHQTGLILNKGKDRTVKG